MNELNIFENAEFGQLRMVMIDEKPYVCASDVAKALGYSNTRDAISRHCRGVVKRDMGVQTGIKADGTPATQMVGMSFIPEGDIYRLIVKSKLPSAERFESWVFDEVLPSIRKNGGYIVGQETLSDDELMARALLVAQNKIAERDKIIEEKQAKIEQMRPKEIFADAVSTSHTSILIGDLAKLICQNGFQIGQKRLFEWMRNNGYLMKGGSSRNMPMQRYVEQGLFEVKESNVQNPDGSVRITRTTKVTGKGQVYFVNKFLANDLALAES
nr:MAG TPA_asm: repressor domain protein [Caudoviricetes sp.]